MLCECRLYTDVWIKYVLLIFRLRSQPGLWCCRFIRFRSIVFQMEPVYSRATGPAVVRTNNLWSQTDLGWYWYWYSTESFRNYINILLSCWANYTFFWNVITAFIMITGNVYFQWGKCYIFVLPASCMEMVGVNGGRTKCKTVFGILICL